MFRQDSKDGSMKLEIMECRSWDCRTLAKLNKELIEDEGHDNPMDEDQLHRRMISFLNGPYRGYLFMWANEIVGYGLVDITRTPLYLRQFYICRHVRRKGLGTTAFNTLLTHLNTSTMDVEVLAANERGRSFWESLGFVNRSIYLRYDKRNR